MLMAVGPPRRYDSRGASISGWLRRDLEELKNQSKEFLRSARKSMRPDLFPPRKPYRHLRSSASICG
tara:strand:+ start:471 stop:671 length:201 start_codon:yes stop_codon:yes gene_type:complete